MKPKKDKTLEAVAEGYLVELINRSMVQVTNVDYNGKAKICQYLRNCKVISFSTEFLMFQSFSSLQTVLDVRFFCRKKEVEEDLYNVIFIFLFSSFEQLKYQLVDVSSAAGIYYVTSKY